MPRFFYEHKALLAVMAKAFLFILLSLVIVGAYFYAPLAKGLKEYTRVLYFHVPAAWVTVLAFLISAWYSLQYLRKRDMMLDAYAAAANQLGILYCLVTTVTGAMWAKASWGAYWNWDPRQTSIFILLLIYAAYFSLRSAVENDQDRARLSAVYSLLAFATVPFFIFIIPRIYESLHPDPLINAQAKIKMNIKMLQVFLSSLTGFTLLFLWLFNLKKRIIKLSVHFEEIEEEYE